MWLKLVEHLLCKCKALNSNPTTAQKKKKKNPISHLPHSRLNSYYLLNAISILS
jgi:hypothetical protein